MLDALDKYKFGLVAVCLTYMVIFVYSNAATFTYIEDPEPFLAESRIEGKEEILEITPDEIDVPDDFNYDANVKNASQSVNDDRQASEVDYGPRKSPTDIAQDIRDLEAQMKNEAGGSAERERIQGLIDQRKKEQQQAQNSGDDRPVPSPGSKTKAAGPVLVFFDLGERMAHNHDSESVPPPSYLCDANSRGVVFIDIKTNHNGNVISAKYNASRSRGANTCMIQRSLEYAKKSRFEYSKKASEQTGYIKYTFVYK